MRHRNGDVGGHARQQFYARILKLDNGVVGDDVLDFGGVHAHLLDPSVEGIAGEGVHLEGGQRAHANLAHVGLVGLGIDQHLGEVLRDGEQGGRLQAGRDGLAHVHVACDYGAVNGGADGGALQVESGLLQLSLALRHLRLLLFYARAGLVDLRFRRPQIGRRRFLGHLHTVALLDRSDPLLKQLQHAAKLQFAFAQRGLVLFHIGLGDLQIRFQAFDSGPGAGQVSLGLYHAGAELSGVNLSNDLAFLDFGVEVGVEGLDHAADLRTYFDRGDRVDGSGGVDHRQDLPLFHRGGEILHVVAAAQPEGGEHQHGCQGQAYQHRWPAVVAKQRLHRSQIHFPPYLKSM